MKCSAITNQKISEENKKLLQDTRVRLSELALA